MVSMQFKKLLREYKTVNILTGILFLFGSSVANADRLLEGKVISLSHNPNNSDLFVAYPQALYRLDTQTQKREPISLPTSVKQVAAVIVQANDADTIYLASTENGVLRSDDGGKTWDIRNEGLPSRNVTTLIRHANQPDTLYAVIPKSGIYRSENAGEDWLLMDRGPDEMTNMIIHSDMPDSMQTGWIFAGTNKGVSRSMDCFCLWREAGALSAKVTVLTYNPNQPTQIYAATRESVFRSEDGGKHWELFGLPLKDITALHFTTSGHLIVGTQSGELFKSDDQAKSWVQLDGF